MKERKNGVVIFYKGKKYTAKEVQELTGYSLSSIYHACQTGNIAKIFFGRKNRKEKMVLKDILPTSLLMHDIRVYVGERLVHDDSFSKRWITFTRYQNYEVVDIASGDYEVTIYLGEEMKK